MYEGDICGIDRSDNNCNSASLGQLFAEAPRHGLNHNDFSFRFGPDCEVSTLPPLGGCCTADGFLLDGLFKPVQWDYFFLAACFPTISQGLVLTQYFRA